MSPFLARSETFERVRSTNDVVRAWLRDGTPEVCVAVADQQSAGRGREGRRWVATRGAGLLLSIGFRPGWLDPVDTWRLAAVASLAMAEAGESLAGLPSGTIALKWPNDLVIGTNGTLRKVGGVLGETDGLGTDDPHAVVGVGVNADWSAGDFPADIAGSMTSLREAGSRRVDRRVLLEAFLERLEARVVALRSGDFDGVEWAERQATTGRLVRLVTGPDDETVVALGVDIETGALIVTRPGTGPAGERRVLVGEIRHVRLDESLAAV
jgi:BirA family biotin operon repressor/biotin-[acetyl-CoA-carboxylase] ligase